MRFSNGAERVNFESSAMTAHVQNKLLQDLLYASPKLATHSLITPLAVIQGIYAIHYGMSLTAIAGVLLFTRIADAITDPLIGYWADRYKQKHGTRKPFMIAGAVMMGVCGYFLYSPPDDVGLTYFGVWFFFLMLGLTLFEVPHMSWGGEISPDSKSKNRTYFLRGGAGYLAIVLFYTVPLLPVWETRDVTPDTVHFAAILSCLFMAPLIYLCMRHVPEREDYADGEPKNSLQRTSSIRMELSKLGGIIFGNKPLLIFLAAYLATGMAVGLWMSMLFILIDVYLGAGEKFAELYLISVAFGAVWVFALIRLARSFGKKKLWLFGLAAGLVCFGLTGVLSPNNVSYQLLVTLFIVKTLWFSTADLAAQPILSDIADYGAWKFKRNHASTLFALFLFLVKAVNAVGLSLGLAVSGAFGFDAEATLQTANAITGLHITMVWLPIALLCVGMFFVARLPITEQRHAIIRKRLDMLQARASRASADPPLEKADADHPLVADGLKASPNN